MTNLLVSSPPRRYRHLPYLRSSSVTGASTSPAAIWATRSVSSAAIWSPVSVTATLRSCGTRDAYPQPGREASGTTQPSEQWTHQARRCLREAVRPPNEPYRQTPAVLAYNARKGSTGSKQPSRQARRPARRNTVVQKCPRTIPARPSQLWPGGVVDSFTPSTGGGKSGNPAPAAAGTCPSSLGGARTSPSRQGKAMSPHPWITAALAGQHRRALTGPRPQAPAGPGWPGWWPSATPTGRSPRHCSSPPDRLRPPPQPRVPQARHRPEELAPGWEANGAPSARAGNPVSGRVKDRGINLAGAANCGCRRHFYLARRGRSSRATAGRAGGAWRSLQGPRTPSRGHTKGAGAGP